MIILYESDINDRIIADLAEIGKKTKFFHLHISRYISPASRYNISEATKGADHMTDEKDAWNSFFQSGSVLDYLQYKSIQYAKQGGELKDAKDEVQDQGTDTQRTEYR